MACSFPYVGIPMVDADGVYRASTCLCGAPAIDKNLGDLWVFPIQHFVELGHVCGNP
jgi:hypothetical protein